MWLFNRPCNVLLKLKRLNKSSESKTQTQQDALLGVGCSSSALSKELWAWKYWRKQTAEPSCQWSITTTSFDTRHPPPDNTPWQLQTAFRFRIWTEIYHRRSDKLGEAATSLTGLTQSPRFSFTITAMWKRGSDNSFWSWGNVTLSCSGGIHPRAFFGNNIYIHLTHESKSAFPFINSKVWCMCDSPTLGAMSPPMAASRRQIKFCSRGSSLFTISERVMLSSFLPFTFTSSSKLVFSSHFRKCSQETKAALMYLYLMEHLTATKMVVFYWMSEGQLFASM